MLPLQFLKHLAKVAVHICLAKTVLFSPTSLGAANQVNDIRGLPITRLYPYDEIANISRGAQLGFDELGRLSVTDTGAYIVLNDNAWLQAAERGRTDDIPIQIALSHSGSPTYYYGAAGSWGVLERLPNGKFQFRSARPADAPAWISGTNFNQILPLDNKVYFAGGNGTVCWDRNSREFSYYRIDKSDLTALFSIGDRAFIHSRSLQLLCAEEDGWRPISTTGVAFASGEGVAKTAPLDGKRVLLATTYKRLLVFDGVSLAPWKTQIQDKLTETISDMQSLDEGSIAIAVRKQGLYILSNNGDIISSMTSHEYKDVSDIAAKEPGILWISTGRGIEKIFYNNPVTVFDQRIGVPGNWPKIVSWNSNTIISAGGVLHESVENRSGITAEFRPMQGLQQGGSWAVETAGKQLLVGNSQGLIALKEGEPPRPVIRGMAVSGLATVAPDTCLAIGDKQMIVLRFKNNQWVADPDVLPGFGYPYIVHVGDRTVWIELGVNRVARVSFRADKITSEVIEKFPWKEPRWINVGIIGDTVVLSGPENERLYFSETEGRFCDAPELRKTLDLAPYWITRVARDDRQNIWGSHEQGVVRFIKTATGYILDASTCDIVRDWHPIIQIINGRDVWFSTSTVLYHVSPASEHTTNPPPKPIIVSIHDNRTGLQLSAPTATTPVLKLPYAQNSLGMRFFAGTYGLRNPGYEFRIEGTSSNWSIIGADSLLTLPNLQEGAYAVEVRLSDTRGAVGTSTTLHFTISPPWFRTWSMYTLYALAGMTGITGLIFWFGSRAKKQNRALEKLVHERTEALRSAMDRLNEETRNAATLAERDRLAQEIHDSVQQGLSGLMLQLDSTLKNPTLTAEVRARLDMARKMVSFTREEVRHAVSDMESPLLENTDLGEALAKMSLAVGASGAPIKINVEGEPIPIGQSAKHHLLRIAQEAMTNAVRHGNASLIQVSLIFSRTSVSISVKDDGMGFDPAAMPANSIGHFGLRSINGRASKIGGDVKIFSKPNQGTTITTTVPLSPENANGIHASDNKR